MKRKSFAKVNLSLDVVSKRSDGYHELDMVMVPIDLFDTIKIEVSDHMELSTNKGYIPLDERNTIIKAIDLMREKYQFQENFKIALMKNTPTQGGMGGGSSNAATTIRMVNDILDLGLTQDEMLDIAKDVGADVSFTLFGKPAVVQGFGEVIREINVNVDFFIFVVKPKAGISTPEAFKQLDLNNIEHFKSDVIIKALKDGDYDLFLESIGNSLEKGAYISVPEIEAAKDDLLNFGFDAALMSGAGSSVFGITQNESLIDAAVLEFYTKYSFVKKSRIIRDVEMCENISIPF